VKLAAHTVAACEKAAEVAVAAADPRAAREAAGAVLL
jgi:hypothetical protein